MLVRWGGSIPIVRQPPWLGRDIWGRGTFFLRTFHVNKFVKNQALVKHVVTFVLMMFRRVLGLISDF